MRINKESMITYLLIFGLISFSLFLLYSVEDKFTGFVIYEQINHSDFNKGIYNNTYYNGSGIVLAEKNIFGTYTSEIFDAGENVVWNNLKWEGGVFTKDKKSKKNSDNVSMNVLEDNIMFYVRNCSFSNCFGSIFAEIRSNDFDLESQYFQYKIIFTNNDKKSFPFVEKVYVNYSLLNSAPVITLIEPQNKSYLYSEFLNISFFVKDNESNTSFCWCSLDNGENIFLNNCENVTLNVSEGAHLLVVHANDSFGLETNDSVSFNVEEDVSDFIVPEEVVSSSGGGSGGITKIIEPEVIIELVLEDIEDVTFIPNEVQELELFVKNNGTITLNNCILKGDGGYASFIFSDDIKNLSVGIEDYFVFDLNIYEIDFRDYVLTLLVNCDEIKESIDFVVKMIEEKLNLELIQVGEMTDEGVKVVYLLKDISGVEQDVEIQFLLSDENGKIISEVKETQIIAANIEKEFEMLIPVDSYFEEELNLLVNLYFEDSLISSTQENIVSQTPIGGFTIFGEEGDSSNVLKIIFTICFLLFSFLIVRRIWKHKKK